jgi:hypothetical protein
MDSKNLKLIADLQAVEIELLTLAPRLTATFRGNAEAGVLAVRRAIEAMTHEANRKSITLLTFDAEAGMAYFHFVPPGTGRATRQLPLHFPSPIGVTVDYDAAGTRLGAEFPAGTPEEALARAATIAAAFA